MKVHIPKDVQCPVCKQKSFSRGADAVAHVESGYCSGCRGKSQARQQIHDFVGRNAGQLLVPQIENGHGDGATPDYPYRCRHCSKMFRNLSSLMNHEEDKHSSRGSIQFQIG